MLGPPGCVLRGTGGQLRGAPSLVRTAACRLPSVCVAQWPIGGAWAGDPWGRVVARRRRAWQPLSCVRGPRRGAAAARVAAAVMLGARWRGAAAAEAAAGWTQRRQSSSSMMKLR